MQRLRTSIDSIYNSTLVIRSSLGDLQCLDGARNPEESLKAANRILAETDRLRRLVEPQRDRFERQLAKKRGGKAAA